MLENYANNPKKTMSSRITSKIAGTALKVSLPITKIASNFGAEDSSILFGGIKATPDMIQWIQKGVDSLTPDQRDYILRNLKKQGVGVGLFLIGCLAFKNISPFHGSVKKQEDDKEAPKDGEALGVPRTLSHNPMFDVIRAGGTYMSVREEYKRQMKEGGGIDGAYDAATGILKENPYVNTITHSHNSLRNTDGLKMATAEIIANGVIPPDLKRLAEQLDSTTNDTGVKRKPKTIWETLELGIPGLRENVKTDLEQMFEKRSQRESKSYIERKEANQEEFDRERNRYELAKQLGLDYVSPDGTSRPPNHPKRASHSRH
jgi:hypothetical protein